MYKPFVVIFALSRGCLYGPVCADHHHHHPGRAMQWASKVRGGFGGGRSRMLASASRRGPSSRGIGVLAMAYRVGQGPEGRCKACGEALWRASWCWCPACAQTDPLGSSEGASGPASASRGRPRGPQSGSGRREGLPQAVRSGASLRLVRALP